MKLYPLLRSTLIFSSTAIILLNPCARASEHWDYTPIQLFAEHCYNSFREDQKLGKEMAQAVFILNPNTNLKSNIELSSDEYTDKDVSDLISRADQIYLNQTLTNLRVFDKTFGRNIDFNNLGSQTHSARFVESLKVSSAAFDAQKSTIQPVITMPDFQAQLNLVNALNQKINAVCKQHHNTYMKLKSAYETKSYNPLVNPEINQLLYPNGIPKNAIQVGGTDGVVRQRMQQERIAGVLESSIYRTIITHIPVAYMLESQTDLQDQVGVFQPIECVEKGLELHPVTSVATIKSSIPQVEAKFRQTIARLTPPFVTAVPDYLDKISDQLEENPLAIRNALIQSGNLNQANAVCSAIHSMQDNFETKQILMPMVVVGGFVATAVSGGTAAPSMGLLYSLFFVGTNAIDIVHSYQMEKRIEEAVLSSQFPSIRGQDIIVSLHNERPFSYVNLIISGMGAAANFSQVSQVLKNNPQLTESSFPTMGDDLDFYSRPYFKPGSTPGVDVITNPKVYSGINELLRGTGVTKSTSATQTASVLSHTELMASTQIVRPHRSVVSASTDDETTRVEQYDESDTDFIKLQKAFSGFQEYQTWLKTEAEKCKASQSKFSVEMCQLIVDIVAGRFNDQKGFVIAYSDRDTSFSKEVLLEKSKGDKLKFITLRLKNGKLLTFLFPDVIHSHDVFYEKIITTWGNMEFVFAGFIYVNVERRKVMAIPGGGSVEQFLNIEVKPMSKEISQSISETVTQYFFNQ